MKLHMRQSAMLVLLACLTAAGCSAGQGTAAVGPSSDRTGEKSGEVTQVDSRTAAGRNGDAPADANGSAHTAVGGPEDFDSILKKYVEGDFFDYRGLKENAADLARFEAFLRWQAQADPGGMSRDEQIAFYINAYNACSIKAVLDHYPVHTPKDIEGFFDGLKFTVAGEELTISQIEYDRLIANYKDMRAHFAVVCADRGCLPLKPGAYTGAKVDEDLESAARKFVADERHFKVDRDKKEVWVSKIFEWYGPKFLNDPERPVKDDRPELYLANWIDDETRALLESGDYTLKIIEWDWTLNEKAN